jgi:hypothetical protein
MEVNLSGKLKIHAYDLIRFVQEDMNRGETLSKTGEIYHFKILQIMSPNISEDQTEEKIGTYIESEKRRYLKKRRENVQVLVALGVIGGYITFAAGTDEIFTNEASQTIVYFLVGVSGLFLFIKMTTVTIRPEIENYWLEIIDETIAPGMYALSVYGLILIAGINYISVQFPDISEDILVFIQGVFLIILVLILSVWVSWKKTNTIIKTEEEMAVELANVLALLNSEDDIGSNRTDELTQRFGRLITTEDDMRKRDYLAKLFDVKISELTPSDRKRINNILERIKIRKSNRRPVSDDVDTLEKILDEIEERG